MADLFHRELGPEDAVGPPVVMLHGLFGSLDNLGALARGLSDEHRIILMDLPNHGRSPHVAEMSYPDMARAVTRTLDSVNVPRAAFFGHSMGGKVAMQVALDHPQRVTRLAVGDIAPVGYGDHHSAILDGMDSVSAASPASRDEAATILAGFEQNSDIVNFILTNWRRLRGPDADGVEWGWRLNLDAIRSNYPHIAAANEGNPFEGPVLFLRGGQSDYIRAEHRDAILALFPHAEVHTVEGAAHWLHADKPRMVERRVRRFLEADLQKRHAPA